MQKRGKASPDDGDALALSFAQVVAPAKAMASAAPTRVCDDPHLKRRAETRHHRRCRYETPTAGTTRYGVRPINLPTTSGMAGA
jgi:hypothetical protein